MTEKKLENNKQFDIPEQIEIPVADSLAVGEVQAFDRGWGLKSGRWEWWLRFLLKICLFVFVIVMNIWWSHRVLQLVWRSAETKSSIHLDNSVLIALVTTSLANFLALVAIVAKHLFPSK